MLLKQWHFPADTTVTTDSFTVNHIFMKFSDGSKLKVLELGELGKFKSLWWTDSIEHHAKTLQKAAETFW